MLRRRRFIIGGLIILAALSYIIYGGLQEAIFYFVTPSELKAKESASADKFLRMGGMVVTGSLQKDLKSLTYRFDLTDGNAAFPVFFRGVPPDQLQPVMAINCPNVLFPYAREKIADATMRAGFPPVHLAPINFEALYQQQLSQQPVPAVTN